MTSETAGGSPTRVMAMRQSKINHSILQKRYREDESGVAVSEVIDEVVVESSSQAVIESKNGKRRQVDKDSKPSPFLEPAKIVPSL